MGFEAEMRAAEALVRLMTVAQECRAAHDAAGLPYPPQLRRMLGLEDDLSGDGRRQDFVIPPPPMPVRPGEIPADWISVPIVSMTPQSVVLGILSAAKAPLAVKAVIDETKKVLEGRDVNPGSIANIGTRLANSGVIARSEQGWALVDKQRAPALHGTYAWGPASIFAKEELAARRREAILYLLGLEGFRGGLQQVQILHQLQRCTWLGLEVNKDMVKMDVQELEKEKKIKGTGSGKLVLREKERE